MAGPWRMKRGAMAESRGQAARAFPVVWTFPDQRSKGLATDFTACGLK